MAVMAVILGLGSLFYILLVFRYSSYIANPSAAPGTANRGSLSRSLAKARRCCSPWTEHVDSLGLVGFRVQDSGFRVQDLGFRA